MSTVLITGSSKGLGKALALKFAKEKYNVIIHGRDAEELKEVQKEIKKYGVECTIVSGDISDAYIRTNLVCSAQEKKIDILINNAGQYLKKSIRETDAGEIYKVIVTNLMCSMILIKDIYNSVFRDRKSGLVININSLAGQQANEQEPIYCASKYGLKGFSDSFKKEAIKNNIVVTDIYLGAMNTSMTLDRDSNKLMKVDEVADVIFNSSFIHSSLRISEITIARRVY